VTYIAIVGGFWELKKETPEKLEKAIALAEKLGAELAKTGFGLVVYFSNVESLEPHVVRGFVKEVPHDSKRKLIHVRYAESQRDDVKFHEQVDRKDLFDLDLFPGSDWEAPFYRSLVSADGVDGVLLMAGSRSTLIAGQIAVARPLPVLAVDEFGGSASVIRTELAQGINQYPSSATHDISQMITWLKERCTERLGTLEQKSENAKRIAAMDALRPKILSTTVAFLLLLLITWLGMSNGTNVDIYPMINFSALVIAGCTGAMIRTFLPNQVNSGVSSSLILGAIAGFAVGIAYLIPQYIGKYGVIDPEATTVGASDRIQFLSSILVALPAGLGFDTIFKRMKEKASEQQISIS